MKLDGIWQRFPSNEESNFTVTLVNKLLDKDSFDVNTKLKGTRVWELRSLYKGLKRYVFCEMHDFRVTPINYIKFLC